jgi:hypothetical protein
MERSQIIQALYDSEITVKTEPHGCWDNGFRAQIGDADNGWEEPVVYGGTWEELMTNLVNVVLEKYPNSTFANRWRVEHATKGDALRSASGS